MEVIVLPPFIYTINTNSNFMCALVLRAFISKPGVMAVEMKFVLLFALLSYTRFSLGNTTGAGQVS